MKKNRIFGLASAIALLAAGACSNDMIDPTKSNPGLLNPNDNSGGVYMTVDFKMPTGLEGTRSETVNGGGSDAGTEVGSEAENNVTSALIVLAFEDTQVLNAEDGLTVDKYGFIVAGEVRNNHITHLNTSDDSNLIEATAKLNKDNLNRLYGLFYNETEDKYEVPPVYVFVFCNPTLELRTLFASAGGDASTLQFGSDSWIDATCKVVQNGSSDQNIGIWSPNSFLMNNKELTTRELPKKLLDWEYFSDYNKAFHLSDKNESSNYETVDNGGTGRGAVLVERSVARFDFKDGSKLGENSYNVLYAMDNQGDLLDGEGGRAISPLAAVQLQKMCLVNMGNEFYYLPRVSENGQLNGPDYELCGREKPWKRDLATGTYSNGNYVVGPYAAIFKNAASTFGYEDSEKDPNPGNPFGDTDLTLNGKPLSDYFNFPFFDDNGFYNQDMNIGGRWDVAKIDDIVGNGNKDNYNGQYNVWRYVVENVIPAGTENQVNGISTGVIFKAQIKAPVMKDGFENASKYDDFWAPGYSQNLANCLSGEKFTFNGNTEHTLQGNSKDDPILYYKDGRLYMGWRHIRQAAIQESVTMDVSGKLEINQNTALYQAVFGDGPIPAGQVFYYLDADKKLTPKPIDDPRWLDTYKIDGSTQTNDADYLNYLKSANYAWTKWSDDGKKEIIKDEDDSVLGVNPLLEEMRAAVTGAGITIYQSSTDVDTGVPGYYCYYYYWNRHNDNHMNGSMGPMEFDVVRNNVYKLSVDNIERLGHPRIPSNDPNSPDPGTKDESDDIYLDVKVQIMPWVVRLNSITF